MKQEAKKIQIESTGLSTTPRTLPDPRAGDLSADNLACYIMEAKKCCRAELTV